jgi:glycosyltransferase involved in cell wall biosynthesis
MRILHIWDQAGVAFVLAKYQRLQGRNSKAIMVREYDKYGIAKFYNQYTIDATLQDFAQKSLDEAHSADILHVHSRSDMVFKFRNEFGNSKKIILHYHGTDIRGIKKQKLPHRSKLSDLAVRAIFTYRRVRDAMLIRERIHSKAQDLADAVIVSTPDLLPLVSKAIYLPNPIDTDHFSPDKISSARPERAKALTMDTEATDIQLTLRYCKNHNVNLDIDVYNRIGDPIMYEDMPAFLKKYELYVDIRYVDGKILENLSKTALEALACGLEVLDHKLNRWRGLPDEYDPPKIISRLETIYSHQRP